MFITLLITSKVNTIGSPSDVFTGYGNWVDITDVTGSLALNGKGVLIIKVTTCMCFTLKRLEVLKKDL